MKRDEAARVAIVTGGNRGIGREICRQLALRGVRVILTARDADKGRAAVERLGVEVDGVEFQPLDVTDASSVDALAAWVRRHHGTADILVNNAGILVDGRSASVLGVPPEVFRDTLDTNFLGPLRLCQAFVPQMVENGYGRVVNLSSGLGQLEGMGDGTPAYRASKTALNALTRMVAAATRGKGVLVNAMCPGWVRTGMGGPDAARSVEEGADTAVWLATLPARGPTGKFFRDRTEIPW
jgi:NAD(P)-dependent dehydrogenase (short-subunit alcohol dehydrogenase family)